MRKNLFFALAIIALACAGVSAQTPVTVPTQHIYYVPQRNLHDTAFIADSLYANGNHDSLISIDYKVYRNGVLIDTISKYGWIMLKLRQMGEEYVYGYFDTGVFVFPKSIPFAGMVAYSFTISVLNAEPRCNRNRVPMLYAHFDVPGTYKIVMEIYSQKNAKVSYIGTYACSRYRDAYSLVGEKRALWTKDSVSFVVNTSLIHTDSATMCEGGIYRWRGKDYTVSGTYKDVVLNNDGTDSVYQLKLTVFDTIDKVQYYSICAGGSCYWRSKYYTQAGVYYDSVLNKNGCMDHYKLVLDVRQHFLHIDTMWRCANTTFNWRGRTIRSAGLYSVSYTPVLYCDSAYQLRVYDYPVYTYNDTMVICKGGSYSWRGTTYTQAGTYEQKLSTIHGCDSVYRLILRINEGFVHTDSVVVCSTNGYKWRGRKLSASGVYTDSLKNRYGCDSVYILKLVYHRAFSTVETDTICAGQSYTWAGHAVSIGQPSAGNHIYWDSLKTQHGCDSVFKLKLTVLPIYYYESSASVCANETYSWTGHAVSIGRRPAGSYVIWDSLKTKAGCDSVYKLNLSVLPNYYTEQQVSICDNEWYVWTGHSVGIGKKSAGSYQYWDSLKTKEGCDSVFKLILTVHPTYSFSKRAEICDHQTYVWKGHAVSIGNRPAGSYVIWDSLKTKAGCDSVYRLLLTVHPNHAFADTVDICDNETYVWKNHAVSIGRKAAGSYVIWDSLKTIYGCDSIYRLQLNVHPTFLHTDTFEICEGGAYLWRGRRLTAAGWYSDSLKTQYGCDSVYRLWLEVHPTYLFEEIVPICNNGMHLWRGRQLTQAGVYTDSLLSRFGCDSVYRLDLRVNPVYLYEDTIDGCKGQSYQWRGRQLVKAGVYSDSLKASFGCDSVFRMVLRLHPNYLHLDTVNICEHAVCRWHGKNYTKPGSYVDTLHSIWGCDSVCRLLLRVHPVYVTGDTVDLCDQELPYMWRGRQLTKAGAYTDSLQSIHGCDSIFTMLLRVYPTYLFKDTISICSHEVCKWRGRKLTRKGDYEERLQSIHSCDSIYKLHLIVRKSYFYYDTAEICDNGYYAWRGRLLSRPGGYVDSLQTMEGCPEVHHLWLRVHPTFLKEDTAEICAGDVYRWHGRKLDSSGIYSDSLRSTHGCDSVYRLHLIVRPTYLFAEKLVICWPQTCMWRGRLLDSTGVYEDRFSTSHGCDSIYRLQLTVNPSYLMEEEQQICSGSLYEWRGRKLSKSGTYTDSLKTRNGCDSVFRLQLQVNPVYLFADTVVICGNENYLWHGRRIRQSGVYTDSLKTMLGCDSVFVLSLTMLPTYYFEDTVDLCGDETYGWRGQYLGQSGVYYDSLKTWNGCDSVYCLFLQVHPIQMSNDFAVICEGESYKWNGRILTEKKRYIDTLKSQYGCDSIVRFFLYTNPLYLFADTVDHCDTGVYMWRGRSISANGCYTDSFKTVYGCDSVYMLVLRMRPLFFKEEQKTICSNETFLWHGRLFNQSGRYYDSLFSQYGCDSVHALQLTVLPAYLKTDSAEICQGAVYKWRGKPYSSAGIYYDSLKTEYGCDSVYRLVLQVYPVYMSTDSAEICQGAVFKWRGNPYAVSGTYYDSLKTIHGCDSLFRLVLQVHPVYLSVDSADICSGAMYKWRGRPYSETGLYYDSLQSMYGCDSIFILRLIVRPVFVRHDTAGICQGASYAWRGRKLVSTGMYYDSLKTMYGCDSVYSLCLTVHPKYMNTDTVEICDGERHIWRGRICTVAGLYRDSLQSVHGCDSLFQLLLKVRPVHVMEEKREICQGQRYMWRGRLYSASGLYSDSLHTLYGCDSIYILRLTVNPVYQFDDTVEICQGERHVWRRQNLFKEGLYSDSLKTVNGCDSIYRLQLYVRPTYYYTDTAAICENEVMQWHGRKLSQSGVYFDSLKTVYGCDSVYSIKLQVNPNRFHWDTVSLCNDAMPYAWHNRQIFSEGDYTDSLKTIYGCDSICRLHLNVYPVYASSFSDTICEGTAYQRHGFDIPADSTVGTSLLVLTDSLRSVNGCDSVVTLSLSIRILPKEMGAISGDTLVSQRGTYLYTTDTVAGIDSYIWQVIPQGIPMNTSGNRVWLDLDRDAAGWDTLVLVGQHVCGQTAPSYFVVHVTIGVGVTEPEQMEGVRLFPNPAQDEVWVECLTNDKSAPVRWMLCDAQGRLLDAGSVEGLRTRIEMEAYPRGLYVVRLVSSNGLQRTLKVVKQ